MTATKIGQYGWPKMRGHGKGSFMTHAKNRYKKDNTDNISQNTKLLLVEKQRCF